MNGGSGPNAIFVGLSDAQRLLASLGRGFALVGGLAVSARCEPRFTRDIDLAVAVDDDRDAESLVRSIVAAGYLLAAQVEQVETGRLATARLQRRLGDEPSVVLDLLFASSGIERELVARAEVLEIVSGIQVPVARTGHLLALKLLARDDRRRPQDALDIEALLAASDEGDLAEAQEATRLIAARGFARGRDLQGSLAAVVERAGVRSR